MVTVPLKRIFGFCDYDKVLCGLKIRFQPQRNNNENRVLFAVANAFGENNSLLPSHSAEGYVLMSVYLFICLYVCLFVIRITQKVLNRIA